MSHNLLLYELTCLGIPSSLPGWINDCLHTCGQRVLINGSSSSPVGVLSSVPHGSMLKPLLFLVFVNDLPNGIQPIIRLYANNCVLYCKATCSNGASILQSDLDKTVSWCNKLMMSLNTSKCYVQFTHTQKEKLDSSYFLLRGSSADGI